MRYSLLFFFILISKLSTGQRPIFNCLTSDERFQFIENAKLITDNLHKSRKIVDTGNNLIFRIYRFYDCPNSYDDEMDVSIKWSIPMHQDAFQITFNPSDSFRLPVAYSAEGAAWPLCAPYLKTAEGSIKGIRNGNIWSIQGNVTIICYDECTKNIERMTYTISHDFILWKKEKRKRSIPF
jgi:hypothetical protein